MPILIWIVMSLIHFCYYQSNRELEKSIEISDLYQPFVIGGSNIPKPRSKEYIRMGQSSPASNSTRVSQNEGRAYASNLLEQSISPSFISSLSSNESPSIATPYPKSTAISNTRANQSPMTARATQNIEKSARKMQPNSFANRSGFTATVSSSKHFKNPSTLAGRAEMLKTKTSSRMHLSKKKETVRSSNSSAAESDRRSGALRFRPRGIAKSTTPGSRIHNLRSSEKSGQNRSQHMKGTDKIVRTLHSTASANRGTKAGSSKVFLKAPPNATLGAGRKPCSSAIRNARKNSPNNQDSSTRCQQPKLHMSAQADVNGHEHPNLDHMNISPHGMYSTSAYEVEMMTALRSKIQKWNDFQNSWKRHYHTEDSQHNDGCGSDLSLLYPFEEDNKSTIDSCEKFLNYLQESKDKTSRKTLPADSGESQNACPVESNTTMSNTAMSNTAVQTTAMSNTAMLNTTTSSTAMLNTAIPCRAARKLDNGTYQSRLLKGPCRGQCLHLRIQQACHSYLGGDPERSTLNRFIGSDLCDYEWCEVSAQMFPFVVTECI